MNYYICDELTLEEGQKKLKLNDFYSFEKTFSEEECNRIIREFDDTATPLEAGSRKAKTSKIHYNDKSDWIYNKISGMVIEANRVMWGFGIFGISEPLQYVRHDIGDSDAASIDIGINYDNSFRQDRKISFLIQLSEETSYEGGEVLLHNNGTPSYLPKERGTTLMFPAWLLNGTTPVTKETKRSLYGWVSGPPFA